MNRLVDLVSRMLDPGEREAVRGDLAESGATGTQALRDVLGLVIRRQSGFWIDWQPWFALVALVVPLGMVLSMISRRMADGSAVDLWSYLSNWTWTYITNPGFRVDLLHNSAVILMSYVALMCWSWTSGFMLGALSRRTIPINGALFCIVLVIGEILGRAPISGRAFDPASAIFASTFYTVIFPPIVQTVLVLLPSLWGMRKGILISSFPLLLKSIMWMAAIATMASIPVQNWAWWRRFSIQPPRYLVDILLREWGPQLVVAAAAVSLALLAPIAYMIAATVYRHSKLQSIR